MGALLVWAGRAELGRPFEDKTQSGYYTFCSCLVCYAGMALVGRCEGVEGHGLISILEFSNHLNPIIQVIENYWVGKGHCLNMTRP